MNSSNDQRNRRILVIDDNRGIHNSFREILRGAASDKSTLDEAEARLFGETPSGRRTLGFTMESAYQGELEAGVSGRTQNLSQANQELRDQMAERKQAEAALRESELWFRQLAENSSEVFWVFSPTGEELFYVSPAYEQIWGWACQSIY